EPRCATEIADQRAEKAELLALGVRRPDDVDVTHVRPLPAPSSVGIIGGPCLPLQSFLRCAYHIGMGVSFSGPGRTTGAQRGARARTRRLMLETATALMQQGVTPSVSDVAEAAAVSRATAYRYFPSQ